MGWRIITLLMVAGLLVGQQVKVPPATFNGTVHGVTKKQVTIETESGNLLDFEINKKTQIMRGQDQISATDLEDGDVVSIQAREVMGRFLIAVNSTAQPK